MRVTICLMTAIVLLVADCWAGLTYQEMQHSYEMVNEDKRAMVDNYLLGINEGISAANLGYYMQTKTQLYCKPQNLDLNVNDIKSIIKDAHDKFDTKGDIPVSYLMFVGLTQTFPCF